MMEALKYFGESLVITEATTIAVCIYKGASEWKYFYVLSVNEVTLMILGEHNQEPWKSAGVVKLALWRQSKNQTSAEGPQTHCSPNWFGLGSLTILFKILWDATVLSYGVGQFPFSYRQKNEDHK
jgi:hypothetical protein